MKTDLLVKSLVLFTFFCSVFSCLNNYTDIECFDQGECIGDVCKCRKNFYGSYCEILSTNASNTYVIEQDENGVSQYVMRIQYQVDLGFLVSVLNENAMFHQLTTSNEDTVLLMDCEDVINEPTIEIPEESSCIFTIENTFRRVDYQKNEGGNPEIVEDRNTVFLVITSEQLYGNQAIRINKLTDDGGSFAAYVPQIDDGSEDLSAFYAALETIIGISIASFFVCCIFVCCIVAIPIGCCIFGCSRFIVKKKKTVHAFAPKTSEKDFCLIFTDIYQSTKIWDSQPLLMSQELVRHNKIIRNVIKRNKAHEVKTIGDAFMIAVKDPVDGLICALEIQEDLANAEWDSKLLNFDACKQEFGEDGKIKISGLKVRIGIDYGKSKIKETLSGNIDYEGPICNRAARVESFAQKGTICVTNDFYNAVMSSNKLKNKNIKFDWQYIGEKKLKGIEQPARLYCVYQNNRMYKTEEEQITKLKQPMNNEKETTAPITTVPITPTMQYQPILQENSTDKDQYNDVPLEEV